MGILLIGLMFFFAGIGLMVEGNHSSGVFSFVLGLLIFIGSIPSSKKSQPKTNKNLFKPKHTLVDEMTGEEYERFCGQKLLTKNTVRKIEYTPISNDYGADIIVYFKDGKKAVVQCKRYSGSVDNTAVQEVVAAVAYYKADCAMLMTNSQLTNNAKELARKNGVKVFEYYK